MLKGVVQRPLLPLVKIAGADQRIGHQRRRHHYETAGREHQRRRRDSSPSLSEAERDKRQRWDQEARPGRSSAKWQPVTGVVDEEKRDDRDDRVGFSATAVFAHHPDAVEANKHDRGDRDDPARRQ